MLERFSVGNLLRPSLTTLVLAAALHAPQSLHAQTSQPKAQQAVEAAVQSELTASNTDKSLWIYRSHDVTPGKDVIYQAVQTRDGELKRITERWGRPLSPQAGNEEMKQISEFVNDPSAQAKQRREGIHDDEQAAALLKMLPSAYIWTVVNEAPDSITLAYYPNPAFDPPNMEARVMGTMAGQMVIAKNGNRIRTLRGKLTEDVKIAFGLIGRMNQGGTFDIERREIAPGLWQITETHVHIGGHALFKTIGQQEDEVKTGWKPSPAHNLQEAEDLLRNSH
ncbi:hypothetical protein [Granulicella sp. S156]|jgi:hypothetical protein|uniref:hypothetical protein n=1 Tax=Granulicella sp. S156 TaxID=1747224 RepID=UPI00131AF139|nr:hypothetical protein [Granulicella sp. S156]